MTVTDHRYIGYFDRNEGRELCRVCGERDHPGDTTTECLDDCTCVYSCADDPASACSLSGQWHVHPDGGSGVFGPCPVHPDAPGDL